MSFSDQKTSNKSFIAVEGPIGVGKTSLAQKLAYSLQGELLLEQAEANPFLAGFYQNPTTGALPAQLFFLFQRTRQLKEQSQKDLFAPTLIADYLIDKDKLFAQVTLSGDEMNLYEQVYQNLTINSPTPDLVIYLQAPVSELLKRLKQKGTGLEQSISEAYLQKLNHAYTDYFHYYTGSPLLIVNAAGSDLVNDEKNYQQLLEVIESTQSGRHYFNPVMA